MVVNLHEEFLFRAAPELVYATFADIETMTSFVGYGPIPGIESARWVEGDGRVGSVRLVKNRDGSTHREDVLANDPNRRLEDRIHGFTSPFRHIVKEAVDAFEFRGEGTSTRLVRTFRFTLTSPLAWPIAMPLLVLFRRAVRRHHATIADRLPAA